MSSVWDKFKEMFGVSPVSIDEIRQKALVVEKAEKAPAVQQKTRYVSSDDIVITEEYKQVLEWLKAGAPIVFISGKAGTGKTTFIRYLRKHFDTNLVVVAPTGVAALNIEGATIHSFFRFPPRIIVSEDIQHVRDRKLYTKMSLLVIDEASMVRADVVDGIDKFLRKNRGINEPFGGVQVLLVGDLFQLPPVLNQRELEAFRRMGYDSPYFFSSQAFTQCQMVSKELTKIFRQSDEKFIQMLNKVREAEALDEVIPSLNERHKMQTISETSITLTCTNRVADQINDERLKNLPGEIKTFTGEVSGKFALEDEKLPSPINLSLKVGAQVMFTKNDEKKRWVNGTLGKVVDLKNCIRVQIQDKYNSAIYDVSVVKWEAFRYEYNEHEDRIIPVQTGLYRQYPLMLAWAVTIHKSQGRTLEKVRVDLGDGAFDYGQVYVALSRCRSLEDIHLVRPLRVNDIKCDPVIKRFYQALSAR